MKNSNTQQQSQSSSANDVAAVSPSSGWHDKRAGDRNFDSSSGILRKPASEKMSGVYGGD